MAEAGIEEAGVMDPELAHGGVVGEHLGGVVGGHPDRLLGGEDVELARVEDQEAVARARTRCQKSSGS